MCSTHLVTRYGLTQRTCKEVVEQGVRKLKPRFVGPFVVVKRVRMTAVELDLPRKRSRMHRVFYVNLVKAFMHARKGCTSATATAEPIWEIKGSLAHRFRGQQGRGGRPKLELPVRWRGFTPENDGWELSKNLPFSGLPYRPA